MQYICFAAVRTGSGKWVPNVNELNSREISGFHKGCLKYCVKSLFFDDNCSLQMVTVLRDLEIFKNVYSPTHCPNERGGGLGL